jgi:hypothetical protein
MIKIMGQQRPDFRAHGDVRQCCGTVWYHRGASVMGEWGEMAEDILGKRGVVGWLAMRGIQAEAVDNGVDNDNGGSPTTWVWAQHISQRNPTIKCEGRLGTQEIPRKLLVSM